VLIFDPHSPLPRLHCAFPGTLTPTLLYVPPGLPQHALAREGLPDSVSPLLVLTEGRAYSYVSSSGPSPASPSQLEQRPQDERHISAFEAAFGPMDQLVSSSKQQQQADGKDMDVDVDLSRPRWRQLFDAPSHALPAPTVLAQMFLRLVAAE
jgi:hypothetical protein